MRFYCTHEGERLQLDIRAAAVALINRSVNTRTTMIELYTAATGNGRRATLMMEESGLPHVEHRIEVGKGARKPAAFLAINPLGTVPVIVDPDASVVLRQSAAILFYLAEKSGR